MVAAVGIGAAVVAVVLLLAGWDVDRIKRKAGVR